MLLLLRETPTVRILCSVHAIQSSKIDMSILLFSIREDAKKKSRSITNVYFLFSFSGRIRLGHRKLNVPRDGGAQSVEKKINTIFSRFSFIILFTVIWFRVFVFLNGCLSLLLFNRSLCTTWFVSLYLFLFSNISLLFLYSFHIISQFK